MTDVTSAAFLALVVAAFIGVVYTWSEAYDEVHKTGVSLLRRTTAIVGILVVSLQAVLSILIWAPLARNNVSVRWLTWGEGLLFLIAVPCAVTHRGRFRGWLLFCSTVLLVFYLLTIGASAP